MIRLLICACIGMMIFSACGHEHTAADQATIALEDIKPAEPTATAVTASQPVTEPPAEEVPPAMEEVVELKDEKPLEQVEEPKKVAAAPVEQKKLPKRAKKRPQIEFAKTTHYFGLIDEGETISTKFFFDNVGDAPLLIKDASATCGCTYPGYPFVPIKPGERSSINVSFNSKGKFGKQKPVVTVMTNASSKPIKLYLEGEVKTEVVSE